MPLLVDSIQEARGSEPHCLQQGGANSACWGQSRHCAQPQALPKLKKEEQGGAKGDPGRGHEGVHEA